jgi:hypothetical protein
MATEKHSIEALTRTMIREKIAAFNERERELCNQAHAAYKSGATATVAAVSDQDRRVNDRARALLNGAGMLLPQLTDSPDRVQTIETELSAVRLALATLNNEDLQRQACEVATWAVKNTPAWQAKVRKLVIAMAALADADAECSAFLEAAGGDRAGALPFTNIHAAFRGIDIGGWTSLGDVLATAVDEGVVKASEIKGARFA